MIVLAVGASGPNAGLVVSELTKLGVTVRGLIRGEAKVGQARGAADARPGAAHARRVPRRTRGRLRPPHDRNEER